MCEVLNVSKAGYYRWLDRPPSQQARGNQSLLLFLQGVAAKQRRVPGYRKLWKEAVVAGYICSQNRVQRLLQGNGYRSCTVKKPSFIKGDSGMPVLPNLLNRHFDVSEPNRVWVSDITQIHCEEGWLYVAVVLDLYSRRVVGWSAGRQNTAELVVAALKRAWKSRQPRGSHLLFHSDQGSQYRSEAVAAWLNRREVTISMSRRGNCWDNACSESFFALLKKEWLHPLGEMSREETTAELSYYIEEYYHHIRRHGTLNMLTPIEFEKTG